MRRASQCGYVAAYLLRTEKFFDLLGSAGFLSIAVASLLYGDFYHARQVTCSLTRLVPSICLGPHRMPRGARYAVVLTQVVVTLLVVAWSVRLGSFLFIRVLKTGKDSRFDELKDDPRAQPH